MLVLKEELAIDNKYRLISVGEERGLDGLICAVLIKEHDGPFWYLKKTFQDGIISLK